MSSSMRASRPTMFAALLPLLLAVVGPQAVAADRSFPLHAFTAVELDVPARWLVLGAGAPGLRARGPKEVLDRLAISVVDDRVRIYVRGEQPSAGQLSIELDTVGLESLTVKGGGQIQAERLASANFLLEQLGAADVLFDGAEFGQLRVELAGSGRIELGGSADRFELVLGGAGTVNAAELEAKKIKIRLDGAGDVEVAAVQSLDVEIRGAGTVRYAGAPKLSTHLSAFGYVARK